MNKQIRRMMREIKRRGGAVTLPNYVDDGLAEQLLLEVLACPDCCAAAKRALATRATVDRATGLTNARRRQPPLARDERPVLVRMRLSDDEMGTDADDDVVAGLELTIQAAMVSRNIGWLDGHEFGGGWAVIFCYGGNLKELRDCVIGALLPLNLDRELRISAESENDVVLASNILGHSH